MARGIGDGSKLTPAQAEALRKKMKASGLEKKKQLAAKATATPTAKPKPMTPAQREAKAMKDLMAKRKAVSKKTGSWPNYHTN